MPAPQVQLLPPPQPQSEGATRLRDIGAAPDLGCDDAVAAAMAAASDGVASEAKTAASTPGFAALFLAGKITPG
jgi:hypothetical protein